MVTENAFHALCVRLGLFKGKSFLEELGFVRYFHFQPINVYLHLVGFHFLVAMVLLWVRLVSNDYLLSAVVSVSFVVLITILDSGGAVGGVCAIVWLAINLSLSLLFSSDLSTKTIIVISLLCGAFGGALQLYGHIFHDHSQPAFRFFEAFVTTPYYLYLSVLFLLGARQESRVAIVQSTMMWKGSERVIYGKRDFGEG
jgi:hypothetical protein